MNKILVFIFQGVTDYEVTFLTHLLNTSGNKEVLTIAYDKNSVKARSGFEIIPSMLVSEVKAEEVEGLIIPGGWYGDLRSEFIDLIQTLNVQGKLLGGICGTGTIFLAKAGVLQEVKYTTPVIQWTDHHKDVFGIKDPFTRQHYSNERVVRDKNIITAIGTAFVDFAVEICGWFKLFESEENKEEFISEIRGVRN